MEISRRNALGVFLGAAATSRDGVAEAGQEVASTEDLINQLQLTVTALHGKDLDWNIQRSEDGACVFVMAAFRK